MNITRLRAILRKRRFWGVVYVALVLGMYHVWTKRLAPVLATLATVGMAFAILFVVQQAGQKPLPASQPVLLTLSPPLVSPQLPFAPSQPHEEDWDAIEHRLAREEIERKRLLHLPWRVVLRMKEDAYAESIPGNHYDYRDGVRYYGDCLLQRAHYRMRRLPRAQRRQVHRLEKAMDDWAQDYWALANVAISAEGFVFSEVHLECGRAIDTLTAHYRHPKHLPNAVRNLRREIQKLVAECEKAEGPIKRPIRHARTLPRMWNPDNKKRKLDREMQKELDDEAEKLRRATLRLRQETKSLHDEPAEIVANYIQSVKGQDAPGPDAGN